MGESNLMDMIRWIYNKFRNGNIDSGGGITQTQLNTALTSKVDKVAGKDLSTNDYTNEDKNKVDNMNLVYLPRDNYNGTAAQLKQAIDDINTILNSPDTELDELSEIVAYIKQNKHILDTLSVSNIAGLQDVLNNKANSNHTHSYNDITGKPTDLVNETKLSEEIGKIKVGGENLLYGTKKFDLNINWSAYHMVRNWNTTGLDISTEKFNDNTVRIVTADFQGIKTNAEDILDEPVMISFWAKTEGIAKFNNFAVLNKNTNGIRDFLVFSNNGVLIPDNKWHRYTIFNPKGMCLGSGTSSSFLEFHQITKPILVSSIKIERGTIPTDWTPSPEELKTSSIYEVITDAHNFLKRNNDIHFGSGHSIANAPSGAYYEMFGFTHSNKNWGIIFAKKH